MGAAGLIDIKRRIKSVESTRKITNAMGLVATSKLRKSRKELLINQKFIDSIETIIKNLSAAVIDTDSIFFKGNKSEHKLYIVITSESGLCGGFNGGIVSYLESVIREKNGNAKVIVVGKRGLGYVKRAGIEPIAEFVDISDLPTIKEAKIIFEKALKLYKDKEISEVNVVYCDFVSPVKQVPKSVKILPIEKNNEEAQICSVEPNVNQVLNDSLEVYLKAKIRSILLSSKCSEQSARMTAMDGATSNANDLLDSLNLQFNRIRQSIITQEISEIVGGAAAHK